jgi:hypothetical protein
MKQVGAFEVWVAWKKPESRTPLEQKRIQEFIAEYGEGPFEVGNFNEHFYWIRHYWDDCRPGKVSHVTGFGVDFFEPATTMHSYRIRFKGQIKEVEAGNIVHACSKLDMREGDLRDLESWDEIS